MTKPFSLPEYSLAFTKFVLEGVRRLMDAKSELWASIPKAEPSESIPITQNTMQSGEVVRNEPVVVAAQSTISLRDLRSCNIDELAAQIDSLADQNLSGAMSHLFNTLGRISVAAGTSVDAGGRPVSYALLREVLEKMDLNFDESGKPELPTLVMNPALAQSIGALPPMNPEETKLYNDLIERKRKQYDARRRDRKLY